MSLSRDIDEITINDFKEVETDLRGIRLAGRNTPFANVAYFKTAWMRTFVARRRQKVETSGAIETNGFDNFQIWRENYAGHTAICRIEDGIDELTVAGEALGCVSCFGTIVQCHCGDGTIIFQIEHRYVVETVRLGVSGTRSCIEDAVMNGCASSAKGLVFGDDVNIVIKHDDVGFAVFIIIKGVVDTALPIANITCVFG